MKLLLIALSILATTAAANACGKPPHAKAKLTIQEFGDFQCPYCAKGEKLMQKVEKDYAGTVEVVFRNRPLQSHDHAEAAAKAYLAVKHQCSDLARKFHDELFDHQVELETKGDAYLDEAAAKVGVDVTRMKTDMASADIEQELKAETDEADRNAIQGVPSFIIGTQKVTGAVAFDDIKKVIDEELKK